MTAANRKLRLLLLTLGLMGLGAGLLGRLQAHQKLGSPGVKTAALDDGTIRRRVILPEKVLDYTSVPIETDKMVLGILPPDTSFGQRHYTAPDKFDVMMTTVLMGADRTSMHKPEFCLTGQGFVIDQASSGVEWIHLERPQPYDLPVMKMVTTKEIEKDGAKVKVSCLYVFWFITDSDYTANHWKLMGLMVNHVLRTGELQRWAYVSCYHFCYPGQEEATFGRMKRFITDAVPQFQLYPKADSVLPAN